MLEGWLHSHWRETSHPWEGLFLTLTSFLPRIHWIQLWQTKSLGGFWINLSFLPTNLTPFLTPKDGRNFPRNKNIASGNGKGSGEFSFWPRFFKSFIGFNCGKQIRLTIVEVGAGIASITSLFTQAFVEKLLYVSQGSKWWVLMMDKNPTYPRHSNMFQSSQMVDGIFVLCQYIIYISLPIWKTPTSDKRWFTLNSRKPNSLLKSHSNCKMHILPAKQSFRGPCSSSLGCCCLVPQVCLCDPEPTNHDILDLMWFLMENIFAKR